MYRVAAVGDRDSVSGFGALGLDVFFAGEPDTCRRIMRQLRTGGEYAAVYITEAAAEWAADEIEACAGDTLPAIIPIPGVSGNTGSGMARVRDWVEKAVGSDIIFND